MLNVHREVIEENGLHIITVTPVILIISWRNLNSWFEIHVMKYDWMYIYKIKITKDRDVVQCIMAQSIFYKMLTKTLHGSHVGCLLWVHSLIYFLFSASVTAAVCITWCIGSHYNGIWLYLPIIQRMTISFKIKIWGWKYINLSQVIIPFACINNI